MNPAIDKIKKLLRMKRGGTPEEIATAIRLAQALAAQHGIDLADINPDDDGRERRIGHVDAPAGRAYEQALAAAIITGWFDCDTCFSELRRNGRVTCTLHIAGEAHDREVGRYVYVFLVRAFRSAWRNRANRLLRNRKAYLHGMYYGIIHNLPRRLAGADRESNAMVQSRAAYLQKLCPNMKTKKMKACDARLHAAKHGYLEGLKTRIRQGVEGGKSEMAFVDDHCTAKLLEGAQ